MTDSGSIFDIVGPVMIGPSSSHTAGAVRLGQLVQQLAGQQILEAKCILYNSFAKTYRGHGTDRGIAAGLLGFSVDDLKIPNALEIAKKENLNLTFIPNLHPNNYSPNTVVFHLILKDGATTEITGHSTGGGNIYVSQIDEYHVVLKGEAPTLIMFYKDQPGMIWQVTKRIAEEGINIASLHCSRKDRGTKAFMNISLDTQISQAGLDAIHSIPDVYFVRRVHPLSAFS